MDQREGEDGSWGVPLEPPLALQLCGEEEEEPAIRTEAHGLVEEHCTAPETLVVHRGSQSETLADTVAQTGPMDRPASGIELNCHDTIHCVAVHFDESCLRPGLEPL